jgi:Spx/MgsR family transcriptional regulator
VRIYSHNGANYYAHRANKFAPTDTAKKIMIKLYGIPNCDTMKKARKWLDNNNLEYEFHNYKKLGAPEKNLKQWVKKAGWEVVLNKRGTTWRKLSDDVKDNVDETSSIQVMLDSPSAIKRPVLENGKTLLIGFKEEEYKNLI